MARFISCGTIVVPLMDTVAKRYVITISANNMPKNICAVLTFEQKGCEIILKFIYFKFFHYTEYFSKNVELAINLILSVLLTSIVSYKISFV